MLRYLHIVLLLLAILFAGCRETTHQQPKVTKADMKNSMEKANRYLLSEEEQDIERKVKENTTAQKSGKGCEENSEFHNI